MQDENLAAESEEPAEGDQDVAAVPSADATIARWIDGAKNTIYALFIIVCIGIVACGIMPERLSPFFLVFAGILMLAATVATTVLATLKAVSGRIPLWEILATLGLLMASAVPFTLFGFLVNRLRE